MTPEPDNLSIKDERPASNSETEAIAGSKTGVEEDPHDILPGIISVEQRKINGNGFSSGNELDINEQSLPFWLRGAGDASAQTWQPDLDATSTNQNQSPTATQLAHINDEVLQMLRDLAADDVIVDPEVQDAALIAAYEQIRAENAGLVCVLPEKEFIPTDNSSEVVINIRNTIPSYPDLKPEPISVAIPAALRTVSQELNAGLTVLRSVIDTRQDVNSTLTDREVQPVVIEGTELPPSSPEKNEKTNIGLIDRINKVFDGVVGWVESIDKKGTEKVAEVDSALSENVRAKTQKAVTDLSETMSGFIENNQTIQSVFASITTHKIDQRSRGEIWKEKTKEAANYAWETIKSQPGHAIILTGMVTRAVLVDWLQVVDREYYDQAKLYVPLTLTAMTAFTQAVEIELLKRKGNPYGVDKIKQGLGFLSTYVGALAIGSAVEQGASYAYDQLGNWNSSSPEPILPTASIVEKDPEADTNAPGGEVLVNSPVPDVPTVAVVPSAVTEVPPPTSVSELPTATNTNTVEPTPTAIPSTTPTETATPTHTPTPMPTSTPQPAMAIPNSGDIADRRLVAEAQHTMYIPLVTNDSNNVQTLSPALPESTTVPTLSISTDEFQDTEIRGLSYNGSYEHGNMTATTEDGTVLRMSQDRQGTQKIVEVLTNERITNLSLSPGELDKALDKANHILAEYGSFEKAIQANPDHEIEIQNLETVFYFSDGTISQVEKLDNAEVIDAFKDTGILNKVPLQSASGGPVGLGSPHPVQDVHINGHVFEGQITDPNNPLTEKVIQEDGTTIAIPAHPEADVSGHIERALNRLTDAGDVVNGYELRPATVSYYLDLALTYAQDGKLDNASASELARLIELHDQGINNLSLDQLRELIRLLHKMQILTVPKSL